MPGPAIPYNVLLHDVLLTLSYLPFPSCIELFVHETNLLHEARYLSPIERRVIIRASKTRDIDFGLHINPFLFQVFQRKAPNLRRKRLSSHIYEIWVRLIPVARQDESDGPVALRVKKAMSFLCCDNPLG